MPGSPAPFEILPPDKDKEPTVRDIWEAAQKQKMEKQIRAQKEAEDSFAKVIEHVVAEEKEKAEKDECQD